MSVTSTFLALSLLVGLAIANPSANAASWSDGSPQISVNLDAEAVDWRSTGIQPAFDVAGTLHALVTNAERSVLTTQRHWHNFAFGSYREVLLAYEVFFPADFDFGRGGGGRLPGIVGKTVTCTDNEEITRQFFTGMAWSEDGSAHMRLASLASDPAGTRSETVLTSSSPVYYARGAWTTVALHSILPVRDNSDVAQLELWVNGTQAGRWSLPQLNVRSRWEGVDLGVSSFKLDSLPPQVLSSSRFAVSGRVSRDPQALSCASDSGEGLLSGIDWLFSDQTATLAGAAVLIVLVAVIARKVRAVQANRSTPVSETVKYYEAL